MATAGGVFCLEGSWAQNSDLTDRTSVEQQLRMLESAGRCGRVIHRDVATREEFDHYLKEWLKKKYGPTSTGTVGYPLAYLAFHGTRGALRIGKSELTLDDLSDLIGPAKAKDRILYFGSCSTMAATESELRGFCKKTGVKAIVGYTRPIDWLESAAFDCLLVPRLLDMKNMRSVFTSLRREHPKFVDRLGLRMATSEWATSQTIALKAVA
jgi:hypothetical protein